MTIIFRGGRWEDGAGPGTTATSLKNLNLVSADELKLCAGR